MSATRPSDHEARRAAQTVFDRPVLLEAGAGTGKTTTLIARALCWCLGPGWERARRDLGDRGSASDGHAVAAETLRGVVAITFTEAAAAEMASRLAASLAKVVDGFESEVIGFDPAHLPEALDAAERRRRATHLLESFDYLTVGTIHAFCYGLLKSYPLEAGLHPDLRVDADGRELESVARLAIEHWVPRAYSAGEETPFLALAAHGIGPGRLLEAVVRWMGEGPPIDVLEPDPLRPEAIEGFLAAFGRRIDAVRALLGDRLDDLGETLVARRVQMALDRSRDLLADAGPDAREGLADLLPEIGALFPDSELQRVRDWARGRLPTKGERERLEDLGEPFGEAAAKLYSSLRTAAALDPALLGAARQALLPLLRMVDEELRRRGVITFSGLLRGTLDLLESSRAVRDRERQRLQLLLVDEFQDTDPVQSRIVRLLGLEGEVDARPSLFVVGDPKQSIYAWRDADLAAYEAFEEALRAAGGVKHSLDVNFRSVGEVLEEVDRVIAPVMRYEHGVQPAFRGLEPAPASKDAGRRAAKRFASGPWRPVEYWISWLRDPATGELRPGRHGDPSEVEAGELAADLQQLHDIAGVPWSRIGILFRKTASQPPFLDELRRRGIPFAVTRDRNYYQRREVIEAAAWVRSIINPTDHLALLTVLRSSVVGVPDAALIPLWSRSLPLLVTELAGPDAAALEKLEEVVASAAAAIPQGIPGLDRIAGWERSLLAALRSLAVLRRSYRRDAADVFVRRLRRELFVEASEAARFQGKFRLANLNRLFRQLETSMESDEADVHAILRALRLGVMESRESEEAMPRDAAEEAVQVMTIHTAKGLEFDHVYVPQLHARTRMGGNDILEATEVATGEWEYHLFGAQTLGYERAEERRAHIEAAETVRTLYVALTRARERVVLIGQWPASIDAVDPLEAKDYVDLLRNRPGLPASLLEPANDPAVALAGFWDHRELRFRFPGSRERHGRGGHVTETAPWLPGTDEVEHYATVHAERRRSARRRSDRPWSVAVTVGTGSRLEALVEAVSGETGEGPAPPADRRSRALRVGTAVHDCLESWRLEADPERELTRQLGRLDRLLDGDGESIAEATELLERFSRGSLLSRLTGLADDVIGREVPLLLAPAEAGTTDSLEAGRAGGDHGDAPPDEPPVGCYAGAIDLLYRDVTGRPVIVDYKTDRVENADEARRRATAYAPQERLYADAVRKTLDLETSPRTELWFLWADTVVAGDP